MQIEKWEWETKKREEIRSEKEVCCWLLMFVVLYWMISAT